MADNPTIRYVSKADAIEIVRAIKLAYTNQDAIAEVKVGNTVFTADEAQDQIELAAGNNMALSIENGVITFNATDTTYGPAVAATSGVGGTDGLLTGADKEKLDGIAAGAQVNSLESVKVNGIALAVTDKGVDVTIATGASGVGTIAVNGTDVPVHGLGTAAAASVSTGIADGDAGLVTGDQVHDYVGAQISSVLKPVGNIAPVELTSSLLVEANLGNVYNLTADLTLDATVAALFKDGEEGETIVEGTDVGVIFDGTSYLFNAFAGHIDLSAYAETDDFGGLTPTELAEVIAEL